jgi:FkbM family methyltransferase
MRIRLSGVRIAIVVVAVIAVYYAGLLYRHARFRLTGAGRCNGMTIYLDPKDRYITPAILNRGEWESGESAEFRRLVRPGDTVIDVGANIGWYTLLSSSLVGPLGRVIAFEPAPPSLELLRKNVAANRAANVVVESKALSDKRGSITLHINAVNRGHHSVLVDSEQEGAVEVEMLPLDEYLRGRSAEIGLIKIDVEGAEGLVLAGMKEILSKRLPRTLIVEFTPSDVRRTGIDPEDLLRRVLGDGYHMRTLDVYSGASIPMDEAAAIRLSRLMEADHAHLDLIFERD